MKVEDFEKHIVFDKLNQCKNAIRESELFEKLGEEEYQYFDVILQFIEERMNLIVPILIEESELSGLSSELESGTAYLNNYLGNNNSGYINNAKNNFSSALKRVKNFVIPLTPNDFDYSKAATTYEKTLLKGYNNIAKINKELQEELAKSKEELEDKRRQMRALEDKFSSMIIDMQGAFRSQLSSFSDFEDENKEVFNRLQEERESIFNEKINYIDKTIDENLKQYEEWVNDDLEKYKMEFQEQKDKLETQTKDTVDKLTMKLEEAKEIVGIIGNVGVTGNYQKIASEHKKTANVFRVIALVFMSLMSSLLIYSIVDLSTTENFDLYKSLVRILAATVLTYPAIYASKESSKHRNLEILNRNLELELASIGPFIELLPEDKKIEIKEDLVKKYFGQQGSNNEQGDEDVSINGFERILKAIVPILKK
ncbi:hypothetical protein AS361_14830 [Myroides marinus]|uniref:coiled-coil domain-containing protein n=1 Tax=Myroides marinus TaxID=703342 RepID=UPI000741D15C|nr:hypothetical protein [Myroides marinus]KUF45100.1 hypothetical protein AS361_14830 [Myroides marinus]